MFVKSYKFIFIKEYVFYKLYKDYVIDYFIVLVIGMFNLKFLKWDEEVLYVVGIIDDKFFKFVLIMYSLIGLDEEFVKEMNVFVFMFFVVGVSDGVLFNLGVNVIDFGVVVVIIGISGVICVVINCFVIDLKGRIFCYVLIEDYWVIGGLVNNGGMIFRWVCD